MTVCAQCGGRVGPSGCVACGARPQRARDIAAVGVLLVIAIVVALRIPSLDADGWGLVLVAVAAIASFVVGVMLLVVGGNARWRLVGVSLIAAPVLGIGLWGQQARARNAPNQSVRAVTSSAPAPRPKAIEAGEGTGTFRYGSKTWTFTYRRTPAEAQVLFRPALPREDILVIGAIRSVVHDVFHEGLSLSPTLRDGLLIFESPTAVYRILLIKEDTGEVHSMTFRRQPR